MLLTIQTDKIETHLFLNNFHSEFADYFFKYVTHMGDGSFALLLLPYLVFFVEFRTFLISLFSLVISGLTAQFFKKIIFYDLLRPSAAIPLGNLHLVDGVQLHHLY